MLAKMRKSWKLYLFLVPVFLPLIIFGYIPAVSAFKLSFTDGAGTYVGFENFVTMFSDKRLGTSVQNMAVWLLATLLTGNIPALLMAELLFNLKSKRASSAYRFLFIIPMMIPSIVIFLVWTSMIYETNTGIFTVLVKALGLPVHAWLDESATAMAALIFIGFPWISGTNFLIYYAGLQGIPESVLESCKLDGAGFWTRFIKIDLPLLLGQLKILLIMAIINGVQAFSLQMMTTEGGPRNATMVPGLWMYKRAFQYNDFGYASAIGLAMFLFILILTIINNKYINSDVSK